MATKLPSPGTEIQRLIDEGLTPKVTTWQQIPIISPLRVEMLWDKVNSPNNNPLMLLQKEKELIPMNQVYVHKEIDGTNVYVGSGEPGRPYDCLLRREHDHAMWILQQRINKNDFVEIIASGLTKAEAKAVEEDHMENNTQYLSLIHI